MGVCEGGEKHVVGVVATKEGGGCLKELKLVRRDGGELFVVTRWPELQRQC